MVHEAYVSFEIAKLLKEKGFDVEECTIAYYSGCLVDYTMFGFCGDEELVFTPTHQKAMAWLREKGIECVVIPIWNTLGKQYRSYVLFDLGNTYKNNYDSYSDHISYEEACEASIKYCLENLI